MECDDCKRPGYVAMVGCPWCEMDAARGDTRSRSYASNWLRASKVLREAHEDAQDYRAALLDFLGRYPRPAVAGPNARDAWFYDDEGKLRPPSGPPPG